MIVFCGENCTSILQHLLFGPALSIFTIIVGLLVGGIGSIFFRDLSEESQGKAILFGALIVSMAPTIFIKTLGVFDLSHFDELIVRDSRLLKSGAPLTEIRSLADKLKRPSELSVKDLVGHSTQLAIKLEEAEKALSSQQDALSMREKTLKEKETTLQAVGADLAKTEKLTKEQQEALQRLLGLDSNSFSLKDWLALLISFVLGVVASFIASVVYEKWRGRSGSPKQGAV